MPYTEYSESLKKSLLLLAREAIEYGCESGHQLPVNQALFKSHLNEQGCCFVTLHKAGQLRGCIGSLTPYQPLINDIVTHAYAAAFNDPRFPAVTKPEISELCIEISILTPQELISCQTEKELLQQLVPFEDGLTLEDEKYRATYLPSVWQGLPDKADFLTQLKIKAGMPDNYWSLSMKAYRYHSICFSE